LSRRTKKAPEQGVSWWKRPLSKQQLLWLLLIVVGIFGIMAVDDLVRTIRVDRSNEPVRALLLEERRCVRCLDNSAFIKLHGRQYEVNYGFGSPDESRADRVSVRINHKLDKVVPRRSEMTGVWLAHALELLLIGLVIASVGFSILMTRALR
jgi:hypothetical protein